MRIRTRSPLILVHFALAIVILGVAGTCLFAQDTMRDTSTALVRDLTDSEKVKALKGQTVVIAEFENINVRGDAVPRILQEKLTTAFIKSGHFDVVERAQLEKALKELKIGMSGLVDPDTQKQIGKLLGASLIVLGSISEANSKVSIDARVVSIESGKAVSAADAVVGGDISTGSANTGSDSGKSKPNDTTADKDKPTASLLGEGTYLGKRENAGVLGGSTFRAAWRERIASDRLCSFSAGNLKGDSTSLLAGVSYGGQKCWVSVHRWQDGVFRRTWQGQKLPAEWRDDPQLRVIQSAGLPAYISLCPVSRNELTNGYRWDGSQYAPHELRYTDTEIRDVTLVDGLFVYCGGSEYRVVPADSADPFEANTAQACRLRADTAADLDGDGKTELVRLSTQAGGGPLEVFAKDGTRKAITENSYGNREAGRTTIWQAVPKSRPYIVVCKNESTKDLNDKDKPSGGYFYLLQWDGDTYSEIWKSPKLDDKVVDLQVCDPKNEGRPSLIVLSEDGKGSVLTRFVAE